MEQALSSAFLNSLKPLAQLLSLTLPALAGPCTVLYFSTLRQMGSQHNHTGLTMSCEKDRQKAFQVLRATKFCENYLTCCYSAEQRQHRNRQNHWAAMWLQRWNFEWTICTLKILLFLNFLLIIQMQNHYYFMRQTILWVTRTSRYTICLPCATIFNYRKERSNSSDLRSGTLKILHYTKHFI